MKTRPLKKLLKELNYTEVSSLREFEDSVRKDPKKPIWFQEKEGIKFWMINTAEGNYFSFDEDLSAYTIGKFRVDIDSEKSAIEMFLESIFGTYTATENTLLCEVRNREQFDKWYNAMCA